MTKKKGFTLIELLIAVALSSVIVAVATALLISFLRSSDKLDLRLDCLQSGRISLQRIVHDIRNSLAIDPASNGDLLMLKVEGGTISYDYRSGKVRRAVNGTGSYLTEEGRVSFLKFGYLSEKLAKIEVGLGGTRSVGILTAEAYVRN